MCWCRVLLIWVWCILPNTINTSQNSLYCARVFTKSAPLGRFSNFHQLGPVGRVGLVVAMSVWLSVRLCVCVVLRRCLQFFLGLLLARRSHEQFQACHWSSIPHHPQQKKLNKTKIYIYGRFHPGQRMTLSNWSLLFHGRFFFSVILLWKFLKTFFITW